MKIKCPKCNAPYDVPEKFEGKKTKCLKCGESFVVIKRSVAIDKWVLNPNSTFPLTILGVDKNTALKLKNILDQTKTIHARGLFNSVAAMVAQTGLRCKEIEDYVANFRESFAEDAELDVAPYCDLDSLFNGKRIDQNVGTSLVTNYGFDNLRFYSRHLKMVDTPRPIPLSHRDRERFEELTRVGLATIGPPITKAGKSGDSFKLNALKESINLDDLGSWLRLCTTVAELITLTYAHSYFATQQILTNNKMAIEDIKGYEVTSAGDGCTCPFCARMNGKKYPAKSPPKTPFHIGCRCALLEIFD